MNATYQALLSLARIDLQAQQRQWLAQHATSVDWRRVVELAQRGGIAGLVAQHLDALALDVDLKAQLAATALYCEARNEVLVGEARRCCQAARDAGLTLAPLKGVALLVNGPYSSLAQRQLSDIDLLTSRSELPTMRRLLEASGFVEVCDPHLSESATHHLRFVARQRDVDISLELHWSALYSRYGTPLADAELFRRIEVCAPDSELPALDATDQLLSLMLHLAVHRFRASLKWLVDIAELVRRDAERIDWDVIYARARALGAGRAVGHVAELCRLLLDAPIPASLGWVGSSWAMQRVSPAAQLITSAENPGWLRCAVTDMFLHDSPRVAAQQLVGRGRQALRRQPLRLG